jgi:hypothetical protein
VRRGAIALQEPGGTEHQRTRADGGDVFRAFRLLAQEGERFLVIDGIVGPETAGHADHVELRAIGKGDGRRYHENGIARHRLDALPDQVHRRAGDAREHLKRSGEIELRHLRKDQKADVEGSGHGVVSGFA